MRFLRPAMLALAALVLAPAGSAAASNPPRLKAEEIAAKNVEARGGLEAWRKIQTMIWLGHIESVRATAPSLQFMLEQQRPDKAHFEINAMGDRTLRVFDGTQGWKLRAAHGRPVVEPFTIQEVRFEQDGPGIEPLLVDYATKGRSLEVAGLDEVEKGRAYHLIVHTRAGGTQHVWVDAQTFLELRYDRTVPGAGGASKTVSTVYRNYQSTDGLKIPSIIETGAGPGVPPDRIIIEKVFLNPKLDAHAFTVPGGGRARQQVEVPFPRRRPGAPGQALPPMLSNPQAPVASSPPPGEAAPTGVAAPSGAEAQGATSSPAQDPGSTPR